MSEAITRLLDRTSLAAPRQKNGQSMVFIIDAAHARDAWTAIMQQTELYAHEALWFGTPWQDQMLKGPSWFVLPATAVAGMAAVCERRPRGIALRCRDPKHALLHARKLLSMPLGSANHLAFHDPAIWAALAMEAGENYDCLLGPWEAVYTPAPAPRSGQQNWYEWSAESSVDNVACHWPLAFAEQVFTTYKDLRWLYWLRDNLTHFGSVPDVELPRVLSNLDYLVDHGIGIDSDLLELSSLIVDGDLSSRTDLQPILTSPERPHRRVAQLLEAIKP
jgi:hypothetical protein